MEFDFNFSDFAAIGREVFTAGCALVRGFLDEDRVGRVRELIAEAHARRPPSYHIFDHDLAADGVGGFAQHCLDHRAYRLLDQLFRGASYEPDINTNSRRVTPSSPDEMWMPAISPHLDAAVHHFHFTINFWVALDECGADAPGILAVRAPFKEVLEFTGFKPEVGEPQGAKGVFNFPAFAEITKALARPQEPLHSSALAQFQRQFAGRIWTPQMLAGDAMVLTNWTLHGTHFAPGMTKRRESVELRFSAPNETLFTMLERQNSKAGVASIAEGQ